MTEVDGLWISPQRDVLSNGDLDAIEDIYGGGTSPLQVEMVNEPVAGGSAEVRVFGLQDGERAVLAAGSSGLGAGSSGFRSDRSSGLHRREPHGDLRHLGGRIRVPRF